MLNKYLVHDAKYCMSVFTKKHEKNPFWQIPCLRIPCLLAARDFFDAER